ncbi:MAG TPA: hypothetical protein VIJ82_12945 [Streptosporangiaceae bacterium]
MAPLSDYLMSNAMFSADAGCRVDSVDLITAMLVLVIGSGLQAGPIEAGPSPGAVRCGNSGRHPEQGW